RKLIDIASKGGNFLLNVGPDSKGNIPPASVERLAGVGKWMKTNGESIYGTTASPFDKLDFKGACTVKGHTLYVHVFEWPAEGVKLRGLGSFKSAKLLSGDEVDIEKSGDQIVIRKSAVV